jgi:hypothetical protein
MIVRQLSWYGYEVDTCGKPVFSASTVLGTYFIFSFAYTDQLACVLVTGNKALENFTEDEVTFVDTVEEGTKFCQNDFEERVENILKNSVVDWVALEM